MSRTSFDTVVAEFAFNNVTKYSYDLFYYLDSIVEKTIVDCMYYFEFITVLQVCEVLPSSLKFDAVPIAPINQEVSREVIAR